MHSFSWVLLHSTVNWVKTMHADLGQEMGMKCFDVIRETYGDELAGAVLFSLMDANPRAKLTLKSITFSFDRIGVIKCIRAISGLGLKESKDLSDVLYAGQSVEITIASDNLESKERYDSVVVHNIKLLKEHNIDVK